jgi:peptide deformylase
MSSLTRAFCGLFAIMAALPTNELLADPVVKETNMEEQTPRSQLLKTPRMGDPILCKKAEQIADPTAPYVQQMVDDIIATINFKDYVGVAGPQVSLPYRIVLFWAPKEKGEEIPLTVMINPSWEATTEEMEEGWEGCLSIPDLVGLVPRYTSIKYSYQTLTGETLHAQATGYPARIVQHECDHLDGKLYIHRMKDMDKLCFRDEFVKFYRKEPPAD